MSDYKSLPLIQALENLKFDVTNALLRVKQDKPIDMSGVDERIEYFCEKILTENVLVKDEAEPIMQDIISTLEELADNLRNAMDYDDDAQDDWDEDEYEAPNNIEGKDEFPETKN